VADSEQVEGLPLERGGGGDELGAGQRGVGGLDLIEATLDRPALPGGFRQLSRGGTSTPQLAAQPKRPTMAQIRFICTLTRADEPGCQSYAWVDHGLRGRHGLRNVLAMLSHAAALGRQRLTVYATERAF